MRLLEQSSDRLVFHASPWGLRGMGMLVGAAGSAILWLMIAGHHAAEHNAWVGFVVGGAFVIVGCTMALAASDRRIEFERGSQVVRVIRRGFLGSRSADFPFASIRDIALESAAGPTVANHRDVHTYYRIVLVLRDGTRVPWTHVATGDIGSQSACVSAARAFGGWDTKAARSGAGSTEIARPTPAPGVPPVVASGPMIFGMPAPAVSTSARARLQNNPRVVMAFLSIFGLFGAGMMGVQIDRLLTWRPVPATVMATRIDVVRGSKGGTSYKPVVTYTYEDGARQYTSSVTTPLSVAAGWNWAVGITARYPAGSHATAYVDPRDPARAYLVHELLWFPLVFLAIPVLFGALVYYTTRWNTRQLALADAVTVPVLPPTRQAA